jgi:hypothetical protein
MTKGEIKGLQEIAMAHGGSLSINPDTGLVEAGFLKQILPAIAGAGLMMIPGMQAWGAGLIVGGAEALRTGDITKGLTAGLGAYGGAGLGGAAGLGSSAAPTASGITAGAAPTATAATSAVPTSLGSTANMASASNALANGSTLTAPTASSFGSIAAPSTASTFGSIAAPTSVSTAAPSMTGGQLAKYGFAAATPIIEAASQIKPPVEEEEDPKYSKAPYSYSLSPDFNGFTPARPNPYYKPQGLGYEGYAGYAVGGMVDPMQQMPNGGLASIQGIRDGYGAPATQYGNIPQFAEGGLPERSMRRGDGIFRDTNPNTANLGADEAAEYYVRNIAKRNKIPYTKMPKTSVTGLGDIEVGPIKQVAAGGSIGGYSDGGRMLKGPGDGMSDSIPATIGSKQPARLADGEFVMPADVVSHLGNGSTDAGAKRLYAMMDKVRKARTGNKKQGKQIKPEKYLPA